VVLEVLAVLEAVLMVLALVQQQLLLQLIEVAAVEVQLMGLDKAVLVVQVLLSSVIQDHKEPLAEP
jgi:hypothetical protein